MGLCIFLHNTSKALAALKEVLHYLYYSILLAMAIMGKRINNVYVVDLHVNQLINTLNEYHKRQAQKQLQNYAIQFRAVQ